MEAVKKEILTKVEAAEEDLAAENQQLKAELAEAGREADDARRELQACRDQLEREREQRAGGGGAGRGTEEAEPGMEELELVERRVTEMAGLLQAANRALLVAGQSLSRPCTPETQDTVEDDLLHEWQLDLEGIELIERNNNLSRRLLEYSKQLREDISKAEGGGGAGRGGQGRLWLSSLYTRLEELHLETERSR